MSSKDLILLCIPSSKGDQDITTQSIYKCKMMHERASWHLERGLRPPVTHSHYYEMHYCSTMHCNKTPRGRTYAAFSCNQIKSSSKWRPWVKWGLSHLTHVFLHVFLFTISPRPYQPPFCIIGFALPLPGISRGSATLEYTLVSNNQSQCPNGQPSFWSIFHLKVSYRQTVSHLLHLLSPSEYASHHTSTAQISVKAEIGFKIAHRFASDCIPQPQRWQEPFPRRRLPLLWQPPIFDDRYRWWET